MKRVYSVKKENNVKVITDDHRPDGEILDIIDDEKPVMFHVMTENLI